MELEGTSKMGVDSVFETGVDSTFKDECEGKKHHHRSRCTIIQQLRYTNGRKSFKSLRHQVILYSRAEDFIFQNTTKEREDE